MIHYKGLKIENAFSLGDVYIPLEEQGLVLILGDNGVGKSSIWETLSHIHSEKTTEPRRKGKIVNRFKGKDYYSKLDFEFNGKNYAAEQYILHSKLKTGKRITRNTENDPPREEDILNNMRPDELTGISHDRFLGTIYLSTDQIHPLIQSGTVNKADFLSQIYGIDYSQQLLELDEHLKVLKKKEVLFLLEAEEVTALTDRLSLFPEEQMLVREIDDLLREEKDIRDDLIILRENIWEAEKIHRVLIKQQQASNYFIEKAHKTVPSIDSFDGVIKDIQNKKDILNKKISKEEEQQRGEFQLKEKQRLKGEEEKRVYDRLVNVSHDHKQKLSTELSEINKILNIFTEIDEISSNIEQLRNKASAIDEESEKGVLEQEKSRCEANAKIREELLKVLSMFKTSGVAQCPFCESHIDPDKISYLIEKCKNVATSMRNSERLLNSRIKNAADLERYGIELSEEILNLTEKQELLEGKKEKEELDREVNFIKDQIKKIEMFLPIKKKIENYEAQITVLLEQVDTSREKINLERSRLEVTSLEKQLSLAYVSKNEAIKYWEATEEIEKGNLNLKGITQEGLDKDRQKEITSHVRLEQIAGSLREKNRQKLDRIEIERKLFLARESQEKLNVIKDDISVAECLLQVFGNKGLRLRRLKRVLDNLVTVSKKYVERFFPADGNKDLTLETADDPDDIRIIAKVGFEKEKSRGKKGKKVSKKEYKYFDLFELSKGEKRKVSLSLLWSIPETLDENKSTSNILVIDEMGNLDHYGKAVFLDLLEESKKNYESIFLTTHDTELQSKKFDKVYKLVSDKDGMTSLILL